MMTLEEKNQILYQALCKACNVLRACPPYDLDWFFKDPERLKILQGGSERDPQGKEWLAYFVNQAIAESGKEIKK